MSTVDYPHFGTCDSCSHGDRPLRSASENFPDAWICAECDEAHEQAVDAALDVAWRDLSSSAQECMTRDRFRRTLAAAIVAFCEYEAQS